MMKSSKTSSTHIRAEPENKDPTPQYSIVLDDYDKDILLDARMTPEAKIEHFKVILSDTRNEQLAIEARE